MRIVTGSAFQLPCALEETARLAQTVHGADRLKLAFVSSARGMVESDREIDQGLAGNIRECAAVESLEHGGNAAAGGFEVALHAHLHSPLGAQFRGIHDAGPAGASNMLGSGPMAALAIDSLGKIAQVHGVATRRLVRGWDIRIAVVAEHALIRDKSAGLRTACVRPGDHAPF